MQVKIQVQFGHGFLWPRSALCQVDTPGSALHRSPFARALECSMQLTSCTDAVGCPSFLQVHLC